MVPILCGIGTALCWAIGVMAAAKASRVIGSLSTLCGMLFVGLVVSLPLLLGSGSSVGISVYIGWLLAASAGNVLGLLAIYAGLRVGKVGVVAALSSTDGAAAASLAIAAGEKVSPGVAVGLGMVVVGVILTAGFNRNADQSGSLARGTAFGICAAGLLGMSLFSAAQAQKYVPVSWVLVGPRVVGVLLLAAPLATIGRIRLNISVLPAVIAAGLGEVAGFALFIIGAGRNVAITAVLASQFAAIAALGAFALYAEKLSRVQIIGITCIAVGVGVVAVMRP